MNTSGEQQQQQQQQQRQQSGGYQFKSQSPSRTPKSKKRPLNPLQNQAQLQKIMSLFQ
jgi:hypothetical protein